MKKLTVYTTTNCPGCVEIKDYLDSNKIEYITKNVGENKEYRDELIALGYKSVPVVTNGKGHYLGPTNKQIEKLILGLE